MLRFTAETTQHMKKTGVEDSQALILSLKLTNLLSYVQTHACTHIYKNNIMLMI